MYKWTFMTSDGRERLTRNKIKKKGTAQGGGGGGGTTCTIELSSDLLKESRQRIRSICGMPVEIKDHILWKSQTCQ